MIRSTLCYISHDDKYLMMHRNKKSNDPNEGKWIGVGGKIEAGETPLECIMRETKEETGLDPVKYRFHGIIHFKSDRWEDEDMYLFTATLDENFSDYNFYCTEGDLKWVNKVDVMSLPMWEGDKQFLPLIMSDDNKEQIFEMTLNYIGDTLIL